MKIIIFFYGIYFNYVFDKTPHLHRQGGKCIKKITKLFAKSYALFKLYEQLTCNL